MAKKKSNNVLSLDDLKASALSDQGELVELKTWGGSVRICPMTPADADKYNKGIAEGRNMQAQVPIVFKCVLEPVFESEAQVEKLGWQRVNEAFMAISGFNSIGVDEAEKNLEPMSE